MMILDFCYPNNDLADLLTVKPAASASLWNVFCMEFCLTFILVYVIFAVAFDTVDTKPVVVEGVDGKQQSLQKNLTIYTTTGSTKAGFAPLSIGFTLGFLCMIGGTVSGGAFNPTRVLAPGILFALICLQCDQPRNNSADRWRVLTCVALLGCRLCWCCRCRRSTTEPLHTIQIDATATENGSTAQSIEQINTEDRFKRETLSSSSITSALFFLLI